jgi:hypothetical protein
MTSGLFYDISLVEDEEDFTTDPCDKCKIIVTDEDERYFPENWTDKYPRGTMFCSDCLIEEEEEEKQLYKNSLIKLTDKIIEPRKLTIEEEEEEVDRYCCYCKKKLDWEDGDFDGFDKDELIRCGECYELDVGSVRRGR